MFFVVNFAKSKFYLVVQLSVFNSRVVYLRGVVYYFLRFLALGSLITLGSCIGQTRVVEIIATDLVKDADMN